MGRQQSLLALIFLLVVVSIGLIVQLPTPLGLDLRGGSQLTLQAKPTDAVPQITPDKLEAIRTVVEKRVNELGVSESLVQTVGSDQLSVQLPGVQDPKEAERILGTTAQLDFREQTAATEGQLGAELAVRQQLLAEQQALGASTDAGTDAGTGTGAIATNQEVLKRSNEAIAALFTKTELTGEKLQNAYANPLSNTSWEVVLVFNNQGGQEFADLTKKVAGTGRSIGIFLDNALLSAPTVEVRYAETGISGGRASITGGFTPERAEELAIQLRGGSLPVPVEIIENRTIGATLGRDSIQRSIYAGLLGLLLVLIFMVWYYRLPGLIADVSLVVYSLITFALFKLLGVTLTLPGIAGFILSIGMAVDANVLIFERTREELRAGKTLYRSIESGFYRAFSSILDSNVTTLIACAALFFLGAGLVKGFALTLALGVVVSMFTAVTCSRTLMLFAISFPGLRKPNWFCPNLPPSTSKQAGTSS